MAATREDIKSWFDEGIKQGATHMIVICDTYDWEDYPCYVKEGQNVREIFDDFVKKGMKIMEVYSLKKNLGMQLAEHRAFNFD